MEKIISFIYSFHYTGINLSRLSSRAGSRERISITFRSRLGRVTASSSGLVYIKVRKKLKSYKKGSSFNGTKTRLNLEVTVKFRYSLRNEAVTTRL
jgi:hypothetical protein